MATAAVCVVVVLTSACQEGPAAASRPSAVVELDTATLEGRSWTNGFEYEAEFVVVERAGVAIVVDRVRLELGAGTCFWVGSGVTAVLPLNQIAASASSPARLNCRDTSATQLSLGRILLDWHDVNGHYGLAIVTVSTSW
jgi:hypothetical protein